MKERFIAMVKEPRKGIMVLVLPEEVMKKCKLKPFMAARWKMNKKSMTLRFSKTVKIKINLSKKEIKALKQIMEEEGYGSIDEVVNNLILKFGKKLGFKDKTDAISFLYPMDFFKKKYWLIEDYENKVKK